MWEISLKQVSSFIQLYSLTRFPTRVPEATVVISIKVVDGTLTVFFILFELSCVFILFAVPVKAEAMFQEFLFEAYDLPKVEFSFEVVDQMAVQSIDYLIVDAVCILFDLIVPLRLFELLFKMVC